MTSARTVHLVVPDGFDDPRQVSGGNVYDQRLAAGLHARGWDVQTVPVGGPRLGLALERVPDRSLVIIDGLLAREDPAALEVAAGTVRQVVLAHMVDAAFPDADPRHVDGQRRAVRAADRVIATSAWTRDELAAQTGIPVERIVVAPPGVDEAPDPDAPAARDAEAPHLLCVGAVVPHKGQDVLIKALSHLAGDAHAWACTLAGSVAVDPDYAERVRARAAAPALRDRVRLVGVLEPDALAAAYRTADLVVAPSRVESAGMAIGDALGRGIPVVASDVGGIADTVAGGGALLVPPGRAADLARALSRWMTDATLRADLRARAHEGQARMPRWSDTAARVDAVLEELR